MIKLLFEDGEDTPSSILLKNAIEGAHIYFSNGSHKLGSKLQSICNEEDRIFVFYDVPPNSVKTRNGYDNFVIWLRENHYYNVNVIPIICIEYFICQLFWNFGYLHVKGKSAYDLFEHLVASFNWNTIKSIYSFSEYELTSLEHLYKSLLSKTKLMCQRNTSKQDKNNSIYGLFYKIDCPCEYTYCSIQCNDDIILKAERLLYELNIPVFMSSKQQIYLQQHNLIHANSQTLKSYYDSIQSFYDNVCEQLQVPSIFVYGKEIVGATYNSDQACANDSTSDSPKPLILD